MTSGTVPVCPCCGSRFTGSFGTGRICYDCGVMFVEKAYLIRLRNQVEDNMRKTGIKRS
jgi:hypothetical protein